MLSTSQFKLCISSFEFSLLYDSCRHSCPSCGSNFVDVCGGEVRISSLLVLLGLGSYFWYRYLLRRIRKAREALEQQQQRKLVQEKPSHSIETTSASSLEWLTSTSPQASNIVLSSTPSTLPSLVRHAHHSFTNRSQNETSPSSIATGDQATETSSIQRSLSLSSGNESVIGETTVARLDMLLGHIADIKKSVIEMDAELFCVEKSAKKVNRSILNASPVMKINYGINEIASLLYSPNDTQSSCPPTPTLEWDSNDINDAVFSLPLNEGNNLHSGFEMDPLDNYFISINDQNQSSYDDDEDDEDEITAKIQNDNAQEHDDDKDDSFYINNSNSTTVKHSREFQLDLIESYSNEFNDDEDDDGSNSPCPSSSSGQGSDLPSPEETAALVPRVKCKGVNRTKKVNRVLEEIKKHGIANDLLNELLKQVKRDSAFFEE